MKFLKNQIIYWFPVYLYLIIIFYFSSLPNAFVFTPSSLKPIFMDVSHMIYHIIEYMVLCFLFYRALLNSNYKHPTSLAVLLSIFYGITDEFHQLFVPFRIFSLLDILANTFGIISVQSILYIRRYFFKSKKI